MRVNVYTEELIYNFVPHGMCEIATAKYISSRTGEEMTNYGIRIFLKSHPDLHYVPPRDDDRSAITFWCGLSRDGVVNFLRALLLNVGDAA